MSWRSAALVLALLAPLALAQSAFDPLIVSYRGYLAADGAIASAAPAAGAVAFAPPAPGAPAPPLRFELASPVRFTPGAAFTVELTIRADALVVARDAEGEAFEVTVEPGGAPVRVALDPPVMAPGSVAKARAHVVASGALYEEGATIALLVRPLMPFTQGALSLVVGGDAPSAFAAPDMRVPAPADLRLQAVPHTEFLLGSESFEPPASHAVNTFVVTHTDIRAPERGSWSPNGTYVVLRGEESDAEARTHAHAERNARIEAAHEVRVNGVPARVHPGLGVIVRADALPLRVECVRHCPAGFAWSYAPPNAPTPGERPSTLVAPPRDTRGIPVSADEPQDARTPLAPLVALAALALAARTKR
ncbi:MAG TPA: hypothetical protein VFH78_15545 [Candidatus Thermoplasmatota archaeon]|nr:hypothetical protein [Candidatus Thermoplasmatota archaeon]